jgi:hypothetical protein
MGSRYYVTGVQLGILIASVQHGEIKTFVKTMQHILDEQFVGNVTNPRRQKMTMVDVMRGTRHG